MKKVLDLTWRSLLLGIIYTVAYLPLVVLASNIFGNKVKVPTDIFLMLTTAFVSGSMIGSTLGPLAPLLESSLLQRLLVWAAVLFDNMASVMIEGVFFAPDLMPLSMLPQVLFQFLMLALITGMAVNLLFPARPKAKYEGYKKHRLPAAWFFRLLGAAAAYLLFYYVFGTINYQLFTRSYYEAQGGFTVPNTSTVLTAESIRAVLIVLSVLPMVNALTVSRKRLMLICGSVLFVVGGLIPLLMQAGTLPPELLLASGVEILFQNFLTGAVAAWLLFRPDVKKLKPQDRFAYMAIE